MIQSICNYKVTYIQIERIMKKTVQQQVEEYNSKQYDKLFSNALMRIKATHIISIIILTINAIFFTDNIVSQVIQMFLAFIIALHDFDDGYLKKLLSKTITKINKKNKSLKIHNNRLKEIATIDFLTNIPNRRYFFDIGQKKYFLAKRHKTELSLFFLDIDFFKKINDTFGHSIGDEILKLMSTTLTNNIRQSDIHARIGGEEFAILLINTNLENAILFSETMRKKIEDLIYSKHDIEVNITVSIGVTTLNSKDASIYDMFKRADEALYDAKNSGRNKVCSKL